MRKLKRNGQEQIPPYVLAFKLELDSWLLTTHYNTMPHFDHPSCPLYYSHYDSHYDSDMTAFFVGLFSFPGPEATRTQTECFRKKFNVS